MLGNCLSISNGFDINISATINYNLNEDIKLIRIVNENVIVILSIIVYLLCSPFAIADNEAVVPKKSASHVYTVAVNKTTYPYHFENKQGDADGLMIDLWKLWAVKQGVEVKFITSSWKETLEGVRSGNIDIHAGLIETKQRRQYFDFTTPFFHQKSYILIKKDLNVTSIEQLLPYTIGVVKDSSHVAQVKALHPLLDVRRYETRFSLFDAALRGELVAFTNLDMLSRNYPHYKQLKALFPSYKKILFNKDNYVGAIAKNNSQLHNFVEQGLAKISQEEKSAIEKKWLGIDKSNDVLVLAFTPERAPYMSLSQSGQAQGLLIDIWRLWAEEMGLKVEFLPISEADAAEVLMQGGADIHIALLKQTSVDNQLLDTGFSYSLGSTLFINKRLTQLTSLDDFVGKNVGVLNNALYKLILYKHFSDINFIEYSSYHDMVNAAELEKIDAFIGSTEIGNARLNQANLEALFSQRPLHLFSTNLHAVTQQKNARLAQIVKEGFSLIPTEKLIELEKRWLVDDGNGVYQMNANKVELSTNEQQFIDQHKVIKIGVNRDWRPIEYVDQNGIVRGINPDVSHLIEQRTGIHFNYVVYERWSDMFDALLTKNIDVLGSATETPERQRDMLFTQSYWDMPWVVIHQKQGNKLSVEDFYGKELAIVKGYHLVERLRAQYPNITLRLVDDHEEGLLAVQRGIVQGLIENIASASELIKRESLVPLDMSVIDQLNIDKDRFAVRKDWPLLTSIINKALATITENEKRDIYEKWFNINISTGFDKNTVLRLSVQIGIVILVVMVVIIVWNRRLATEVKTRKQLEEQMKHMATHDELTGLANRILLKDRIHTAINYHQRQSLQMAVLFIDLDGFKTINDVYGHDVGDELLVQVAQRLSTCIRKSDTIVRFGGDEFVLLLTGLHNKGEAAYIGDKVLKLVQQPFSLSAVSASIGCSIGIAVYPDDGITDTDLLKEADTLMYQAKANGKNHYVFKTP